MKIQIEIDALGHAYREQSLLNPARAPRLRNESFLMSCVSLRDQAQSALKIKAQRTLRSIIVDRQSRANKSDQGRDKYKKDLLRREASGALDRSIRRQTGSSLKGSDRPDFDRSYSR